MPSTAPNLFNVQSHCLILIRYSKFMFAIMFTRWVVFLLHTTFVSLQSPHFHFNMKRGNNKYYGNIAFILVFSWYFF